MNEIHKIEDFNKLLHDYRNNVVVLFFSAIWSDESKLMNDIVIELVKNERINSTIKFLKIEAEEFEEISLKYEIEAVPTFILLKDDKVLQKVIGVNAAELRKHIEYFSKVGQTLDNFSSDSLDLDSRLQKLVNTAPVTLFMKGSPQEPRCGFSRQIIEILKNENCHFSYFDILSDNEVRQGLKKFSNWPTYPQLYINGELIGGLDILKELVQNNEFKSIIPNEMKESLDSKLKKLINKSKVMLFMKGNKLKPQCGFSRQIIDIMNQYKIDYTTFDILTDEEVRAGLKKMVNWPTYPQLYVEGEFIGGLDIVKELAQVGELETVLKIDSEPN